MKRAFFKRRKGAPKSTYRAPYGYALVERMPLRVGQRGIVDVLQIQIRSKPGYGPEDIRADNIKNGVGSRRRRERMQKQ